MRRVGVVLLIVGISLLGVAATAAAGVGETESPLGAASPGSGEVVVTSPDSIRLEFSTEVTSPPSIRVFDADGNLIPAAVPTVDGSVVTAGLPVLSPGRYLVDWDAAVGSEAATSGAYFFTFDPSGVGAIGVTRTIDDGGLPVTLARTVAFVAATVGLGALVTRMLLDPQRAIADPRSVRIAAVTVAVGAAVGLAVSVVVAEGTVGGLASPSAWTAVGAAPAGAWWLVTLLAVVPVPYLLLRAADDETAVTSAWWRSAAVATLVLGLVGLIGAAAATASSQPWLAAGLVAVGLIAAAAIGSARWRTVGALAGVAAAAAFVVLGLGGSATDVGERVSFGAVALEFDIAPAQVGVNEFHVYGFDTQSGGLAQLDGAVAYVSMPADGIGPLQIDMIRAGPNHFLTYSADLPMVGIWEVEFRTAAAAETLVATIMVDAE
jgi:methionine-rich copper-binding protein CopC